MLDKTMAIAYLQYGGTHVIHALGLLVSRVNLESRTAYVCNGNWDLYWDDHDIYCRRHGFLNWIRERPADFKIEEIPGALAEVEEYAQT